MSNTGVGGKLQALRHRWVGQWSYIDPPAAGGTGGLYTYTEY